MKFNQYIPQTDMIKAYETLKDGVEINGNTIRFPDDNITAEAELCQEQAFVNTQNSYNFEFGTNAPDKTAALNNIILGQNNAFIIIGFRVLLGYGANGNNRRYVSRGFTQDDESLYSAQGAMTLESNTPVQKISMRGFKEQGDYINGSGFMSVKPLRILTGTVSKFQFNITFLNPITALTLSSNLFISVRPVGALGLA